MPLFFFFFFVFGVPRCCFLAGREVVSLPVPGGGQTREKRRREGFRVKESDDFVYRAEGNSYRCLSSRSSLVLHEGEQKRNVELCLVSIVHRFFSFLSKSASYLINSLREEVLDSSN